MSPGGNGNIWLVFTGISAPVFWLTDEAQLPSSSKLKNPPATSHTLKGYENIGIFSPLEVIQYES